MTKTFLILRAKEEALQTAHLLSKKDFETIIEPIFTVEKIEIPKNFIANKNPQALIVTSANACDAIINLNLNKQIKVFAIGHKTASKLIKNGFNNIFYPQENSASALKKVLESLQSKSGEILYFCGDAITLDFKSSLEPLGFNIVKVLAYKIKWNNNFSKNFLQKIAQMQKENRIIDSILFFSQNSLRNFYILAQSNNLVEYFSNSTLLCFSEKIALQAKNLGFKNVGNFDLKNYV